MTGLLILDCDGVLTPNRKEYDVDGKILSKAFSDHDRTGIKLFKARGWNVCILSGDTNVNQAYANQHEIDFFSARGPDGKVDKVSFVSKFTQEYGIPVNDMIYIGDDIFDLPIMELIVQNGGKATCPADAVARVRQQFQALPVRGGEGVVMDLYCRLFNDFDLGEFNY